MKTRGLWLILIILFITIALGVIGFKVVGGRDWTYCTYQACMVMAGSSPQAWSSESQAWLAYYSVFTKIVFFVLIGLFLESILEAAEDRKED